MLQTPLTTDQPTKKKSRRLLPLLSGVLVLAVLASALVFSVTAKSGGAHAASVAASTHCAAKKDTYNSVLAPPNAVTLFWVSMKTTWCWNGTIVTTHSTTLYWGVTTTGNLTGWHSEYNPKYTFNCYVAARGKPNCSGNHEWMQEDFVHGVPPFEDCYLSINQWEHYNGGFSWSGSQHCVPN